MNSIDDFVLRLSKKRNTSVIKNPYLDSALANNLRVYLNTIDQLNYKPVLLVGEALGFKGGGLTGIPFSSGQIFERFEHPFLEQIRPDLVIDNVESENTATIVWEYLSERQITPLCWNAFPFHPHPKGNRFKNRAPTAKEMKSGARYLRSLQALFQIDTIVGVGNKGAQCAKKAFPDKDILAVRHPSYGGKRDFIQGLDEILFSRR